MAEGGFSALRVAVVVGFIAAAIYHCPPDAIEQLSARYPHIAAYLVVFFIAKDYICPTLVSMCYTGPFMSTRRKTMVATWEAPGRSGEIYAELEFDMTNAKKYIDDKAKKGVKVTITHLIIKAVASALKAVPSVNGRIMFGRYIPFTNVDVSCLVNIDNGSDLAMCRITDADKIPIEQVGDVLRRQADKLRKGKDEDFEKSKGSLSLLPVAVLKYLLPAVGFLASGLGLTIKALGVKRFLFGGAVVTSVGMMGLDSVYVPFTPWARVPLFIMVGAIKDRAVVEDGKVVVRPILKITATLDHRFLDGAQGSQLAAEIRRCLLKPGEYIDKPAEVAN